MTTSPAASAAGKEGKTMEVETVEVNYKEISGVFWYPTGADSLEALKRDGLTPNTEIKPIGKRQRRGLVLFKHLHEAAFNMEANGTPRVKYVLVEVKRVPLARLPRGGADDAKIDPYHPDMYFARSGFILPHEFKILDVVNIEE